MILPTGTNSVSDTGIKTEKKSVWKFFPGKFILSWDILIVSKRRFDTAVKVYWGLMGLHFNM